MKRTYQLPVLASLLLLSSCNGYNNIMRKHLSNSDNYKNVKAVLTSI